MARKRYCVLKGRPVDLALDDDDKPHIEIRVAARGDYRVAVNAQSIQPPHELLFASIDPFEHTILRAMHALPYGLTDVSRRRSLALDYTRGLIRRGQMKVAPFRLKGPKNDLREFVGFALAEAIKTEDASLYAFGESWGPEPHRPDQYFGFSPGQGVHDVHKMALSSCISHLRKDGLLCSSRFRVRAGKTIQRLATPPFAVKYHRYHRLQPS